MGSAGELYASKSALSGCGHEPGTAWSPHIRTRKARWLAVAIWPALAAFKK